LNHFVKKNSRKRKLKRIRELGIVENDLMSGFIGNDFVVFRFTLWEILNIE
jgi:hypothetical protein